MNILDKNWYGSLEQMLDDMPENRPLYKDSGQWTIRSEDLETIHYEQGVSEDFFDFISRAYKAENIYSEL